MSHDRTPHIHTDPSQDFMFLDHQPLDAIFKPKTVALIGAKDDPGTVGGTIMSNLLAGKFPGKIYPVNPKRAFVHDVKAYPNIGSIPEAVELAIIVTPAQTVLGIIRECVAANVKAAIIISAGFKELGPEGLAHELEIIAEAKKGGMRIIGPNCLGVMNPIYGLNATFAKGMALPGNLAFISQSGAMCTAVLDWSFREGIGFSSFVSIGSMADVNWGDLIDYLGDDPLTHSILIYMETIGDSRSFLTAAREIALEKPIIVIKPGRSLAAAKAAASHTGSLAGSDEVFDASLERVGVLRVNGISELFGMASVLSRQPRPKGPNLTIVTNAGGPSVLATDATAIHGAELSPITQETVEALNQFLPQAWSHHNPVDILGDASPERYAKTIEIIAQDPKTDGILVILSPQDVTDPEKTAEYLKPYANLVDKPILASWMGGESVAKGIEILTEAKIPVFEYPDDAAATFASMWRYSKNINSLYETPATRDHAHESFISSKQREEVRSIIDHARKEGRELLSEFESKKILSLYGIPIVETLVASTIDEAVAFAKQLGFPIVLKLFSETITHKTDVGGVKLNLNNEDAVRTAYHEIEESVTRIAGKEHFQGVTVQKMIKLDGYELILGSSIDDQFGPVLLFGTGGQLVEVFKDRALALPPLTNALARRLMHKTKIYEALEGVRGRKPVDLVALEEILVSFSRLIVENRWIKECDINPLLASPDGLVSLDARIVLYGKNVKESELPKLAIRPYPSNYIVHDHLKNGLPVTLRPIKPEDEPLIAAFHKDLSENSVRQRYFEFLTLHERVAHDRLIRICFNDYDREFAIVAEIKDSISKELRIIGASRLTRIAGTPNARFTLVISDLFQNLGLGWKILNQLIHIGKMEKIENISAAILSENHHMINMCRKLGFQILSHDNPQLTYALLKITP